MSLEQPSTPNELSEVIAERFGANATYVEALLARFRSDPSLVDESWRTYFEELLGNGQPATAAPPAPAEAASVEQGSPSGDGSRAVAAARQKAKKSESRQVGTPGEPKTEPRTEAIPIRGAALKIVENMEASLAVPTATSQRRIPVKLLEENRRIINTHLQDNDRGKASFTHLIAFAMLRALEKFPQMNDGFETVD